MKNVHGNINAKFAMVARNTQFVAKNGYKKAKILIFNFLEVCKKYICY